jgi:F-type H+-transporting ATPase subunit gamma
LAARAAGMESVASESGARLSTMQFVRHNIEEKRSELEPNQRLPRQEEITIEMLNVATGAAATRE